MKRAVGKTRVVVAAIAAGAVVSGCVSFGVDSYEEFRSAVKSGATCEQLTDMKKNFDGTPDEDRVAVDLEEIACETRDSTRIEGEDRQ